MRWAFAVALGFLGCGGAATSTPPPVSAVAPEPSPPAIASVDPNAKPAGPTTQTHPDYPGLEITDVVVGTGPEVKAGDTIEVYYVGTLDDGTVFDETKSSPAKFGIGVGMLIKGWDAGVPGMHVGGTRKLHIPASLGYGAKGAPPKIPPYAALNFTIEVLSAGK